MIRIIDKRDTGKTKKLLEECSKEGGIFICKHPERILDKCFVYDILFSNITPCGYDEALKLIKRKTDKNIYIDELEEFLNFLFNNKLSGYSKTI